MPPKFDKSQPTPAPQRPVSEWVRTKKPEPWKLAGAAAGGKWELETGYPSLTEDEFDAAIQAAGEIRIG